jgi:hypothetical protein
MYDLGSILCRTAVQGGFWVTFSYPQSHPSNGLLWGRLCKTPILMMIFYSYIRFCTFCGNIKFSTLMLFSGSFLHGPQLAGFGVGRFMLYFWVF